MGIASLFKKVCEITNNVSRCRQEIAMNLLIVKLITTKKYIMKVIVMAGIGNGFDIGMEVEV